MRKGKIFRRTKIDDGNYVSSKVMFLSRSVTLRSACRYGPFVHMSYSYT